MAKCFGRTIKLLLISMWLNVLVAVTIIVLLISMWLNVLVEQSSVAYFLMAKCFGRTIILLLISLLLNVSKFMQILQQIEKTLCELLLSIEITLFWLPCRPESLGSLMMGATK